YSSGKDMNLLLTGKVAYEDAALIEKLQEKGLAEKNKYFTQSFNENRNTNDKLEFLLSNLR
ncbi:MAG: tyrosine/phenylalanine carboxypeptidase domain-containing protein, partial [Salinimicrobium sp.]